MQELIDRILAALDEKGNTSKENMSVDLLHAVRFLDRAWQSITSSCISKCFAKAGFCFPKLWVCEDAHTDNDNNDKDGGLLGELERCWSNLEEQSGDLYFMMCINFLTVKVSTMAHQYVPH